MYKHYKIDISFAVAQGTCYGNQLILVLFADVKTKRLHSLLCHSENGMQYRLVNARINSGTNATSCKNLVQEFLS